MKFIKNRSIMPLCLLTIAMITSSASSQVQADYFYSEDIDPIDLVNPEYYEDYEKYEEYFIKFVDLLVKLNANTESTTERQARFEYYKNSPEHILAFFNINPDEEKPDIEDHKDSNIKLPTITLPTDDSLNMNDFFEDIEEEVNFNDIFEDIFEDIDLDNLAEIEIPEIEIPDFKIPEIVIPEITVPELDLN
ncbi:hypothetical protein AN641_05095 [Candidatus Epulonipiscioides gigas]|nr:hypothetical protein AN641_05095 [Epulopiscium sp. SCG-C07WGA-EpuloA2]